MVRRVVDYIGGLAEVEAVRGRICDDERRCSESGFVDVVL